VTVSAEKCFTNVDDEGLNILKVPAKPTSLSPSTSSSVKF